MAPIIDEISEDFKQIYKTKVCAHDLDGRCAPV